MSQVILNANGEATSTAGFTGAASAWQTLDGAENGDTGSYVTMGQYPDIVQLELDNWSKPAGSVISSITYSLKHRRSSAGNAPQYRVDLLNGGVSVLSSSPDSGGSSYATTGADGSYTADVTESVINGLVLQFYGSRYFETPPTETFGRIAGVWVYVNFQTAPTVTTIYNPTGTVNNTLTPTYYWNHNGEAGVSQSKFHLKIFTSAQSDPGGAGGAVYSSGIITSSSEQSKPSFSLTDGQTYYYYVTSAQTINGVDQWGDWSVTESGGFQVDIDQGVPSGVLPGDVTTESTSVPFLYAGGGTSRTAKAEWQVASDSGFSVDLQTMEAPTNDAGSGDYNVGPTLLTSAGGVAIEQGVWYLRSRFTDVYALAGDWSTTQSFTVAHAPSAAVTAPTGGVGLAYSTSPDVEWTFSDPYSADSQTAYEVESWLDSAGSGSAETTGKVSSALTTASLSGAGITTDWKDVEARWRVRVYDQDDVASAWSLQGSFYLRDLPTPAVTAPTDDPGTVSSQAPTITWTFTASDGRTQSTHRVQIHTDAGLTEEIYNSGTLSGAALSHTLASPILEVDTDYWVTVTVTDSTNLGNSDTNEFTAVYAAPTTPIVGVDITRFEDLGRVILDWSGSTSDASVLGWRVYRRLPNLAWVVLYDSVPSGDVTTKTYTDFTAPASLDFEYAVAQVAVSVGDQVESAYPVSVMPGMLSPSYFLVLPQDPTLNLRLDHVTSEDFEDEQEMDITNLVGRGRRVEYGTRFGQGGSISASLRDNGEMTARQQRLWIEAIRDSGLTVYMRNPFGDVWEIAMPGASVSRTPGVGQREETTVTISYKEITA